MFQLLGWLMVLSLVIDTGTAFYNMIYASEASMRLDSLCTGILHALWIWWALSAILHKYRDQDDDEEEE